MGLLSRGKHAIHSKREVGFLEGKPTLFLSIISVSNNLTGQTTLNAAVDQGQQPEAAFEITINVIEDESATFRCQSFTTLTVRPPGSSTFGTTIPPNLRVIGFLTFEFQNVSQSDNRTAFQCRGGQGFTNIGVIIVLRKS